MTRDEATAAIVMKSPLSPQDANDVLDCADDPGGLETLMRIYAREGRGPDRSTWQTIAAVIGEIEDAGAKYAPLVSAIIAIAPLL